MFGTLARALLLVAAFVFAWPLAAVGEAVSAHHADVDSLQQPWSAIGKLYNETGGSCSGVVIARNKVLTAAHCVFNARTRQFIPADALHFLVAYRTGRYAAHARVLIYQIGTDFDPSRYAETSDGDWAVLTLTERLPDTVVPLRLRADIGPSGTKLMMAGYPQDRAHALTADSDCELRGSVGGGRLLLHTCRGVGGYSGAPLLVRGANSELQIAGIQIAKFDAGGVPQMLAVPAPAIARLSWGSIQAAPSQDQPVMPSVVAEACDAPSRLDHALLIAARPDDQQRAQLLAAISAI